MSLLLVVAMAINNRDATLIGMSPFFFTHGYYIDLISIEEGNLSIINSTRP
jgi:hypothetical protein